MKMVVAIVQDRDVSKLLDNLMDKHIGVTKLSSTGGFLKSGNTTLLIGIDDERLEEVKGIVGECCKSRERIVTPVAPVAGAPDAYMSYPVKVLEGGANIFVIDVEEYHRY